LNVSRLVALLLLGALMSVVGCGGGGSGTVVNNNGGGGGGGGGGGTGNSVPLTVDAGPAGLGFISADVAFADVTVCVPGTNNCQTIDHVAIDTGSSGLRILQSALTLPLAQEGNLVECFQFVSGFTWGPVTMADVKIAGEVASNIPIQVVGQSTFPTIPAACQNSVPGGGSEETLGSLGANGLLGVSFFVQDCGNFCTAPSSLYYSCSPPSTCTETGVPLAQQPPNPVAMFSSDNNGVLIQMQAINSALGQSTATGTMFFGIGTQSNNGLGAATIFHVDQFGNFTTVYNNQSYPGSFLDSGSNGIFFLTSQLAGMSDTNCGGGNGEWYCPNSNPTPFATTTEGTTGNEAVDFNAESANTLFNGANTAFNDLTGPNPSCFVSLNTTAPCFDWGLPFFFGRNVFVAIEGRNTPVGNGPYWAY
jgi:hypothetical protein